MKKYLTTKKIALTGILCGIEILFQLLGNIITPGAANINLTLIPIAISAIICGPISGLILGLVAGVMNLCSPSTLGFFMSLNPPMSIIGTIIICLLKTSLAALVASYTYKFISKKNDTLALIISSFMVPVVNTLVFFLLSLIFYLPYLTYDNKSFSSPINFLIFGIIGWNFLVEILITASLSPAISKIISIYKNNK